jgi:TRAP-type mannitol/chloroaromatic compound transport system permease small subunit
MTASTTSTARSRGSRSAAVGGWTLFAAVMMIVGGVLSVFQGISAIAKDDVIVKTPNYTFGYSISGWGWIHLILGIVVFLAGCALFANAVWARVVGVLLAGLSMLANFGWLPHYPVWSVVLIAIDIAIIWALCTGSSRNRA